MFKSCSFIVCSPFDLMNLALLSARGVARSTPGMAGLQSVPTDGRRNWSLISHILDVCASWFVITHKIGVAVPLPVTILIIVDLKRLCPDYSFQDEVQRPDLQGGLYVLDPRGREETSWSLESGTWALGENFKHVPLPTVSCSPFWGSRP